MKVLTFNCSPKMNQGNTAVILALFVEGMKKAGAEVEELNLRKLSINPCRGDFICWFKDPGNCYQDDDMKTLLPKMADADIWVFAAPLYVDSMPGPMKNLLDRMMPLLEPDIILRDGHCRHPLREGTKPGKIVLISSCGFWEKDNFDSLIVHMELFGKNFRRELAGALLRPHAGVLKPMIEAGAPIQDVLNAAEEAGRQLAQDGEISAETQDTVSRPLAPCEVYLEEAVKGLEKMRGAHGH